MTLDYFKEYIDYISQYDYYNDIIDISRKICSLTKVFASNKIFNIKSKTKEVYESTDFEGIEIKHDPQHHNEITQAKQNCLYIINRLIVLGFKKIAEHELEKGIKDIDLTSEIPVVYNSLKLALKKRLS